MNFMPIFNTLTICLIAATTFAQSSIVISEIMYNDPASGIDQLEFIELYNSTNVSINLNGWSFTQGITHTFSGTMIQPGEFLVVAFILLEGLFVRALVNS